MSFLMSVEDSDNLNFYLYKLFTNKQFIEDAKKDYDLNKTVEHTPLTEEDKNRIISYIKNNVDYNIIKLHYAYLVEMRRKHIDSDFDFIPDDLINDKIDLIKNQFCYENPYFPIYASLFKEFKEVCRIPGKMPKVIRRVYIPYLDYHKLENCLNEDGSYNLKGTGIYFEN